MRSIKKPISYNSFTATSHSIMTRLLPRPLVGIVSVVAGFWLAAAQSPIAPPSGLVAWWRGNGDYADVLENSPLQASPSVSFTPGVVGQGFECDGLGGLAMGASKALYLQDFSVEGWVRRASLERTTRYSGIDFIGGGGILGSGTDAWSVGMLNDGRLYLAGGVFPWPTSERAVTDLNWHHIGITKSGSRVEFFLDGQPAGQAEHPSDYRFEYGYVLGGMRAPDWVWECWWGALDEIAVYSRPLLPEEIAAIHDAGAGGKIAADLRLRLDGAPPVAELGATLLVRLWVLYAGDQPANGVVVNYTVTPGLTLVAASPSRGTVTREVQSLVWDVGFLTAGGGGVYLDLSLTAGRSGVHTQSARATYPGPDVQPANDRVQVTTGVWWKTCVQAPPNLVGWWQADGTTEDALGHGAATPIDTVVYRPGIRGQAFNFRGDLDGAILPLEPHYSVGDFTIETWVQRPNTEPGFVNLGLLFSGNGSNFGLALSPEGAPYSSPGADYQATGAPVVRDTAWHHVAMTRAGSNLSYYVDGQLTGTAKVDSTWTLQAPLAIGALGTLSGPGLYSFPGGLDELSLFDRALSELEVLQVYLAGSRGKCWDDIAVWSVNPPSRVLATEESALVFRVENRGQQTATGVNWAGRLPTGLELVQATNSVGSVCAAVGAEVACELGSLAPGAGATVELVVRPAIPGTYQLQASVTRVEQDLAQINNTATLRFEAVPLEVSAGADRTVAEGNVVVTFQVELNLPSLRTNSVRIIWRPVTATSGRDYYGEETDLVFLPGATNLLVSASVIEDSVHELTETFELTLTNAAGPAIVRSKASCFIVDDEPLPLVTIGHATVVEGAQGSTLAVLPIQRMADTEVAITVLYATTNDTAQAGLDYADSQGSVVFPPGAASDAVIAVPVLGDQIREPNETFLVRLSLPPGQRLAQLNGAPGVGTILDDDAVPGSIARFQWDPIPSVVVMGEWFPVKLTALDALGQPATLFSGPVQISGGGGSGRPASLIISEVTVESIDEIELQNVTTNSLNVSGWEIIFYDATCWPAPRLTVTLPAGIQAPPKGVFRITEEGRTPGTFPRFYLGEPLVWGSEQGWSLLPEPRQAAVVLRDPAGVVRDVFCARGADPTQILVPQPLAATDWNGAPLPEWNGMFGPSSYQRWGSQNDHADSNWTNATPTLGVTNRNLRLPFADAKLYRVEPETPVAFLDGVWQGRVRLSDPIAPVALVADDGHGHVGYSALFTPRIPNDLSVSLVCDQASFVYGGTGAMLTIAVTNPGPDASTGVTAEFAYDVALGVQRVLNATASQGTVQILPGSPAQEGRVRAQLGELPPGSNASVQIQFMPMPNTISGATSPRYLTLRASVSRTEPDGHVANNSTVLTREISSAALSIIPLAWWRGENNGTDVFGVHPAALLGATEFGPGRVGQGFELAASDSSLEVPSASDLNPGSRDFAFETWVRLPKSATESQFVLAAKESEMNTPSGPMPLGWSLWIENGKLACRISDALSDTAPVVGSASSRTNDLRDGLWHHVAFSVARGRSDGLEIYLDGARLTASNPTGESGNLANDQALVLGQHPPTHPGGDLDESAYYSRALTSTEIRRLYEAGPNGKVQFRLGIRALQPEFPLFSALEPGLLGHPYTLTLEVTNSGPLSANPQFTALTSVPITLTQVRSSQGKIHLLASGPDLATGALGELAPHAVATVTLTLVSTNTSPIPTFLARGGPTGSGASVSLTMFFVPDTDGDGMIDGWESEHGLNWEDPTDADGDLDGDGASNLAEAVAGTLPDNPASRLVLTVGPHPNAGIAVWVQGQRGRVYRLERTTRLGPSATWTTVGQPLMGSGATLEFIDPKTLEYSCVFYRVNTARDWEGW